MLFAVMVMGVTVGGAQRWVDVGPVQVQPSEFAKLGMVIVLAGYFAEKPVGEHMVFLKALCLLAVPALLVFMQPDLGTALVFGAIFAAMAYIAGAKLIQLAGLVAAGALAALLTVKLKILEEYQVARLTAFSDPDCTNWISYQVCQSKMAIGSGGITGKGLDATTLANLGFLPEENTDFIFSNLAERVGFVGSIVLILLFFFLGAHRRRGCDHLPLPRLRERRDDDGDHAGHRHTAAVHQLRAQQPGGQRPLFRPPAEHRYALEGRGLEASDGIAFSMRQMAGILSLRQSSFCTPAESARF
jgi:hypothetical protein